MLADIAPMRELGDTLAAALLRVDVLEKHPVLATLPNFQVHIEAIREHLRATISHITFLIEQYEMQ